MTPEYQYNFVKGMEFQDYASNKLREIGLFFTSYASRKYQITYGENSAGIEIKFDDRMKETGNVYFETDEKSNVNNVEFVASGIFRNDNTWLYAIGDYDVIYICGKVHLRQVYEREKERDQSFARFVETPTSKGMLLPQKYVEEKLAARVIKAC